MTKTNSMTKTAIWAAWNALHTLDPSPVKRIALALDLPPAEVAAVVYPVEQNMGEWHVDQEEDVTETTWEPAPDWVADEIQKAARGLKPLIALMAGPMRDHDTYDFLRSVLGESQEYLQRLIDLDENSHQTRNDHKDG